MLVARTRSCALLAVGASVWWLACTGERAATDNAPQTPNEPDARARIWADPLADMAHGPEQLARLCARSGDDLVRSSFCAETPPEIGSLRDLQAALRMDSDHVGGQVGLSITAHTTALATRSVSSINPRVIAVRLETPGTELAAVAFARGEQFVEVLTRDRHDQKPRFYLVAFKQACNEDPNGCSFGDLLTPLIEQNWSEVSLYDEHDVSNTVLDCAPCHQPDGPDTPKLLRMHELDPPWTHWFFKPNDGGGALVADYFAAKGDEPLAGMGAGQLEISHPGNLSMIVTFGGSRDQPNVFPSQVIEDEVRASAAAVGGMQPLDNSIAGYSETWLGIYRRAQRGEAMTVPYHDVKITDPVKLERMTTAYQAYRAGELPADRLPDIRDVLPDDPQRLAEMGLMTEPGLEGEAVLVQACSQCHNERLDQALSRARFRPDLAAMTREEKDLAIARLMLPPQAAGAMPPPRLKLLTAQARARAIAALQR